MTHDDKNEICVFCQKPIPRFKGWSYGNDDEHYADFVAFDKLGFTVHAHRPCADIMLKPFTKELDERMESVDMFSNKHDKILEEWETVVASVIHTVRLNREGVSIRKITVKLNVSMYFVRQILNRLKQL